LIYILLAAIQLVLRSPHLAAAVHSIASRVLLSMLLVLPQMPPASLSLDPALHGRVLAKAHELCTELGSGTTSAMSKNLGLVIRAGVIGESEHVSHHPSLQTYLSRLITVLDVDIK
jgi:hypothetical protein